MPAGNFSFSHSYAFGLFVRIRLGESLLDTTYTSASSYLSLSHSYALGLFVSNQQSMLLCLLGTGPRMLEGRPAQTNRSKGPGRGRSKPLRRGDQTNVMTADEVMGRVHGSRRDPWKDKILVERLLKPSILPRPRARRSRYHGSWRADEHSDGGSGELSGDDLARFHGLVLPRSRGFGDKQPLKKSWATSFVMVRLPDEEEIITSTRPGEVAFYEAVFPAGLRFPIHPTIRYSISLTEFRNLFSLNSNPKPDQGWLYFKARNKKGLLGGYPSNVKGWKSKFFFVSGDEWEIPEGTSRKGATRISTAIILLGFYGDEMKVFEEIFRSVEESGRFSVPVLLESKSFHRVFISPGSRASRTAGDNLPSGEAPSSSSDVAMSKRVSFKKIGEKLGKAAGASSGTPAPAKGVVIGEKRAGESITSSPSKKGKADDGSKGKGVDIGPKGKKKASSSSKASATPTVVPSRPGEGTSAHLGAVPGPTPSILGSLSVAERLLRGVIPPADKEKVDKLTLDQTATKLFHVIGQLVTADFEQQLAESHAREQQALEELAKVKGDRDSLADHLGKSSALVNELREALNKAKESAVEEFKSLSEFMVAVEDAASKYFGEGFDFYKVQLRRHHPDLAIDLEGTVVDQDLLAEQDEAAEERERENLGENKGGN
ncbi:hypothetical protein Acr_00g0004740 [Actinidia rufa]|uniref:Uncharacterized protein n=1 Tax=Actinidia rufa TaxID=165716 RepID=A0A7J0D7J4_9ERIC|nr:hypothetical protein Acr_00g0004740 [Actinidia rufa]